MYNEGATGAANNLPFFRQREGGQATSGASTTMNPPAVSSMLYRVTKDGETNYLYGSSHFHGKISAEAKAALETITSFVIEAPIVDPDTIPQMDADVHAKVAAWWSRNIDTRVTPDATKRLGEIFPELPQSPIELLKSLCCTPMKLFCCLEAQAAESALMNQAFEPLAKWALDSEIPVHGLEKDFGTLNRVIYAFDLNLQEQLELIGGVPDGLKGLGYFHSFISLYESGNVEGLRQLAIDRFSTTPTGQKYLQYTLFERDRQLAEAMENHLNAGNAFVSIGASHLFGVLERLLARGFTIEPIKEGELLYSPDTPTIFGLSMFQALSGP